MAAGTLGRTCPRPEALVRQKLASLDGFGLTWLGVLREEINLPVELPDGGGTRPDWSKGEVLVLRRNLQELFKARELPGPGSQRRLQTQLGMRLKELIPDLGKLGRDRRYQIPSLPKCQKHFEKLVGGKLDWDA